MVPPLEDVQMLQLEGEDVEELQLEGEGQQCLVLLQLANVEVLLLRSEKLQCQVDSQGQLAPQALGCHQHQYSEFHSSV